MMLAFHIPCSDLPCGRMVVVEALSSAFRVEGCIYAGSGQMPVQRVVLKTIYISLAC